jgi:hypothetical protein
MITDDLFKRIFADPENIGILADFLESVLDLPKGKYRKISVVTEDRWLQRRLNLRGIFDVEIQSPSGCSIDVEIRLKSFPLVKKSATITITEESLSPEYLAHHEFYDFDPRLIGSDCGTIETHNLILSNVRAYPTLVPREEKLKQWLCFLKAKTMKDFGELATRIQYMDMPMLNKAIEIARSSYPKMKTVS